MLQSLSALQFNEWMAFAQVEPFGEERADLRMAILATTMVNLWRGKDSQPAKIVDFMPKFEQDEPMSEEEAIAAIDAAFTAFALASGGLKPRMEDNG